MYTRFDNCLECPEIVEVIHRTYDPRTHPVPGTVADPLEKWMATDPKSLTSWFQRPMMAL